MTTVWTLAKLPRQGVRRNSTRPKTKNPKDHESSVVVGDHEVLTWR